MHRDFKYDEQDAACLSIVYRHTGLILGLLVVFALSAGIPATLHLTFAQLTLLHWGTMAIGSCSVICVCFLNGFWRRLLWVLIVGSLAFSFASWRLLGIIGAQLPIAFEGQDFPVVVEIDDLPKFRSDGARRSVSFVAKVIRGDAFLMGRRLRLGWYYPPAKDRLMPGSQWQFTVRVKRPRGTANPHGFDYQAWLLARGIAAVGYVRDKETVTELGVKRSLSFHRLRYHLDNTLFGGVTPGSARSLLKALLIGDKSGIDRHQWQVLQVTGTVHLMAISGLHIGLVAGIGFWLGKCFAHLLSLYSREGTLWLPVFSGLVLSVVYAGLAGFAIPTQRALVMVALFSIAYAQGRRVNYWQVYFLAMAFVTVIDPFAFITTGFWLSFSAVAVLVYCFGWRRSQPNRLLQLVSAQVWILCGLAAPLALLGLPSSVTAPFCNLVAVPVVSIAIVPLLLLAACSSVVSMTASLFLLNIAQHIIEVLWVFLSHIGNWDSQFITFRAATLPTVVVTIAAVLLLLSPSGLKLRLPGLALMLALLFPSNTVDSLRLTVLDVQQGLAVVFRSAQHTLVYDTGASYGESFDMGSRVVVPFLRTRGARHVDVLLISHGDNDHAGGARSIVESIPTSRVISGEPQRLEQSIDASQCQQGDHWRVNDIEFDVLWPLADTVFTPTNNNSCVLLISFAGNRMLLAGDIQNSVEQQLIASGVLPQGIDVLIVPHHGSQTSSSRAFVRHVHPRYAVISAGYRNRYQLPSHNVISMYEATGAEVLRTDRDGAITFVLQEGGLTFTTERASVPKPWYP